MVLALGSALDLTLRERNALLEASGFAAAYRDVPLDADAAYDLRRAVDLVLDALAPNGAVAVDHAWNLLRANRTAMRLFETFVDLESAPPNVLSNIMVATLHPLGLRGALVNFEEVAAMALDRGRRERDRTPDDPKIRAVARAVEAIDDLPPFREGVLSRELGPFVTLHLRRGRHEARLFTTISTIGTPIDATCEELRIETYFPADEATATLLRELADEPSAPRLVEGTGTNRG